jgi:hypothetical protein
MKQRKEKEKEKEDYWDIDDEDDLADDLADDLTDDDPGVYTYDDGDNTELKLMYCPDADANCDCDHADPHPNSGGCLGSCVYTQHYKCEPYIEKETELNSDVPEVQIPDEIAETGGL